MASFNLCVFGVYPGVEEEKPAATADDLLAMMDDEDDCDSCKI